MPNPRQLTQSPSGLQRLPTHGRITRPSGYLSSMKTGEPDPYRSACSTHRLPRRGPAILSSGTLYIVRTVPSLSQSDSMQLFIRSPISAASPSVLLAFQTHQHNSTFPRAPSNEPRHGHAVQSSLSCPVSLGCLVEIGGWGRSSSAPCSELALSTPGGWSLPAAIRRTFANGEWP